MFKNSSKKSSGQISVFLAMGLMSIFAMLAFIINVGMFVKAKINLQNAVDSAAWSGAAVQARQLTRIAHLNWELRNNFKEWMFKYYVIGQMGLDSTNKASFSGNMNFRPVPFASDSTNLTYNSNAFDKYNVPSICIHQGSGHNLCKIATIPGLPRFSSVGLPNVSQNHESILNSFVVSKATDCSRRTTVNFLAAQNWAYGTGQAKATLSYPQIASTRPGAWIRAIEIALRIRNQELFLNLPPNEGPICRQESTIACVPVSSFPSHPLYERRHKAFMSAFRNLGGGKLKEVGGDELSSNFVLDELSPQEKEVSPKSLSGFLIPKDASGSGKSPLVKRYVDLLIDPINYVTFFTFFSSTSIAAANLSVPMEAACSGTKTALPVPGFIIGFHKNPKVLTYYAVKGRTKYTGLFNPFTNKEITLSAYAAAKPMGGRIGPRLFDVRGEQSLQARDAVTVSFASTLNPPGTYGLGMPIPKSSDFWATAGDNIGGVPETSATGVKFVIPNMIYDFEGNVSSLSQLSTGSQKLITIKAASTLGVSLQTPDENKGLYNPKQYELLRKNLPIIGTAAFTSQQILTAISKARAPTKYDRLNYLIPSTSGDVTNNNPNIENMPDAISRRESNMNIYSFYAPLYGPNTLFPNGIDNIENVIQTYMTSLDGAINIFIDALKDVSDDMRNQQTKGGNSYTKAANSIWKPTFNNIESVCTTTPPNLTDVSLSGQIYQFFKGTTDDVCGIESISKRVTLYLKNSASGGSAASFRELFSDFYFDNTNKKIDIYSAYSPGTRQGAERDGTLTHPYFPRLQVAKRNFYSTKLIKMQKILTSGTERYGAKQSILMENSQFNNSAGQDQEISNYVDSNLLNEFGDLNY